MTLHTSQTRLAAPSSRSPRSRRRSNGAAQRWACGAVLVLTLALTVACPGPTKPDDDGAPKSVAARVSLETPSIGITPVPGSIPGALVPGRLAEASDDDLVLIGELGKYIIARNTRTSKQKPVSPDNPTPPGAIIDAQGNGGGQDALKSLVTGYTEAGGNFVPIAFDEVRSYSEPNGGAIIATGSFTVEGVKLDITQRIVLPSDQPHLIITTKVSTNTKRRGVTVRIGDRITFGPGQVHAGWTGPQAKPVTKRVTWLGHESHPQGYGYTVDGKVRFNTAFYVSERGGRTATYGVEAQATPQRIERGKPFEFVRRFCVSGQGLTSIRAWVNALQGKPAGRVRGQIVAADQLAPESVKISLFQGSTFVGNIPVRSGLGFDVSVPPGNYKVRIRGPWGLQAPDQDLTVETGAIARIDAQFPKLKRVVLNVREEPGDAPIPATIVITRRNEPTYLGDGSDPLAAGSSVFLPQGTAEIKLPPGSWRLLATRGYQYNMIPASLQIDAASEEPVTKNLALTRVWAPTDTVRADLRTYSQLGPHGVASPETLAAALTASGVDFAVIADADPEGVRDPVAMELRGRHGLRTIAGMTAEPYAPVLGLFTAMPVRPKRQGLTIPTENTSMDALLGALAPLNRDAPPFVSVAWPRTPGRTGYFDRFKRDTANGIFRNGGASYDIKGIELFPGGALAEDGDVPPIVDAMILDWVALMRRDRVMVPLGASGVTRPGIDLVGVPFTYVNVGNGKHTPGTAPDPKAVMKAVGEGNVTVSTGPLVRFTMGGKPPGSLLRGGSHQVNIEVVAPEWVKFQRVQLFENDRALETWDVDPQAEKGLLRLKETTNIQAQKDAVYYVRVSGSRPIPIHAPYRVLPFALSNAIRVDANGDGRWNP